MLNVEGIRARVAIVDTGLVLEDRRLLLEEVDRLRAREKALSIERDTALMERNVATELVDRLREEVDRLRAPPKESRDT